MAQAIKETPEANGKASFSIAAGAFFCALRVLDGCNVGQLRGRRFFCEKNERVGNEDNALCGALYPFKLSPGSFVDEKQKNIVKFRTFLLKFLILIGKIPCLP